MIHQIRFLILKKRIKKNPYLGKQDIDGTYLYKNDGYTIRYRIINLPTGQISIEWISQRRRLSFYEERIRRIKKRFLNFWYYQKWFSFLRPSLLLVLIVGAFLFYSEVIEKQETKMVRLKWVVAALVGIDPKDVQYIGDGWLEISGERIRRGERIYESPGQIREPVKYTFNPLRWIFSSDIGFFKRWRTERGGGYATQPVIYNNKGDVWIKKIDRWEHGKISGKTIKWDRPRLKGKKAPRHEITVEDRELKIINK